MNQHIDPTIAAAVRESIARLERQRAEIMRTIEGLHAALRGVEDKTSAEWVPLKLASYETHFSCETIRRWAHQGVIAGERRGGRWLISMASVRSYIRSSAA